MTNNYQEPEVFEIGRAKDVVLGGKGTQILDSQSDPQPSNVGDIEESDE